MKNHDTMRLTASCLRDIEATIGSRPAETGGIITAREGSETLRCLILDDTAKGTATSYTPAVGVLNAALSRAHERGERLKAFIHSHPSGFSAPSHGDWVYMDRILAANPGKDYFLMIVQPSVSGGRVGVRAWRVWREEGGLRRVEVAIEVVPDAVDPAAMRFDRVRDAYDVARLSSSTVVCVGVGGAMGWLLDMVRAGLGRVVLFDADDVEEANLGTQGYSRSELGMKKVHAARARIFEIDPGVDVSAYPLALDDQIDDEEFSRLALRQPSGPLLLAMMTDSFAAQARGARLGLKYSIPTLAAQVYQEGRGVELAFADPRVQKACLRCCLGPRYRSLARGEVPAVGSSGTPIAATQYLNALKTYVALALLHEGSPHPFFGPLLRRIGQRNLVQVRLDPDLYETLGIGAFQRALSGAAGQGQFLLGEPLWIEQLPEGPQSGFPPCADCGGLGDLREAASRILDSRELNLAASRCRGGGH